MLHLGTAAALLLFFWRDWWSLAIGVLGLASQHQIGESRRVLVLIVIVTQDGSSRNGQRHTQILPDRVPTRDVGVLLLGGLDRRIRLQ